MTKVVKKAAVEVQAQETAQTPERQRVHFIIDEETEKRWKSQEFGYLHPIAIGVILGEMVASGDVQSGMTCPKCEGRVHIDVDSDLLTKVAEKHRVYKASLPVHPDDAKEALENLERELINHKKGCPRLNLDVFQTSIGKFQKNLFDMAFGKTKEQLKEVDARALCDSIVETDTAVTGAVNGQLESDVKNLMNDPGLIEKYGADAKKKVEEELAHTRNLTSAHQQVQALYGLRRQLRNFDLKYAEQRNAERVAADGARSRPQTPRGFQNRDGKFVRPRKPGDR